jgi:hypothetical protein
MPITVTEVFARKYTLRATVTTQDAGGSGIINVPAEFENHWLKRLGFTIGIQEDKAIRDLQAAGLLDMVTLTRTAATTMLAHLVDDVNYDPSRPAGERIQFYVVIYGPPSGAIFFFFAKLPHSIQH